MTYYPYRYFLPITVWKTWTTWHKKMESCKLLILLAWLLGNHLAPLKVHPCWNFLIIAGTWIFKNWYPSEGRKIAHFRQSSANTTPMLIEPSRSGRNYCITIFTKARANFESSNNTRPMGFLHFLRLFSLEWWRSELFTDIFLSLFIW